MTGPVVPAPALAATQAAPESALAATQAASEPDLAAFVGLVGLVLTGFLVLARLSQQVVDDAEAADREPHRSGPVGSDRLDDERPAGGPAVSARRPDSVDDDSTGEPTEPIAQPDSVDGDRSVEEPTEPVARPGDRRTADADRDSRDAAPAGRPVEPADAGDPVTMTPGMLLVNVALTQGLFGVVLAGGAWYFGVPADALGLGGDPLATGLPALAVGVGFGVVLWVGNELASGLAAASDADYDEGLRELLAPEGVRGWTLLLGATLPVIAVVEEFIFRAAVIGGTTAAFDTSAWALAVVSSAAFALGHGAQGRVGVVVTGGLGFALAAAFVLTDSLLAVVVAHYLVNALEFAVHEGLGLPDPIWS